MRDIIMDDNEPFMKRYKSENYDDIIIGSHWNTLFIKKSHNGVMRDIFELKIN